MRLQFSPVRLMAILAVLFGSFCFAREFSLMEKHVPRNTFVQQGRADPDTVHEVVIAVRKRNMQKLKDLAIERATPGNPLYQQWLRTEEVDEMVVNKEGHDRVQAWIQHHSNISVTWVSRRWDYIKARAPIHVWEKALNTQFHIFDDRHHQRTVHRALDYSIPSHLVQDVAAIFYTVQVPPVLKKKFHSPSGAFKTQLTTRPLRGSMTSTSSGEVTVSFLNSYYQISSNIGNAALNQSVFETDTEYFSPGDLTTFQDNYDLTVQSAYSIGQHSTSKCQVGNIDCLEGNLDIQYIMGVAQVTSSIYWWVSDYTSTDPFVA